MKVSKVTLTPAKCGMDLGDGSERGFYVNQDYILRKMHRPMRGINLMYCYYPLDATWPARACDAFKDQDVSFAWDYPYDNYFPYMGGKDGDTKGEPFTCMRDVRSHGQEVVLTLTCDPHVTDDYIRAVANDLKTFGRMSLRLNHEAAGDWFSFNKRASYQEVADFWCRFTKIVKEIAPNVTTIICAGAIENEESTKVDKEDEFVQAFRQGDVWAIDQYMALNWGWPYEVAKKDNFQHKRSDPALVYDRAKRSFDRFVAVNDGVEKPMIIAEFNADGDVTGPFDQAKMVKQFFELIKNDKKQWLKGVTMYQFRDDGRLGLEITDPNNPNVGIEQPLLAVYRDIANDEFFKPGMNVTGEQTLPATLRWGSSEDADGISIELDMEGTPVYAEANFPDELKEANLMLEIDGYWFYKAPGQTYVDFMPAFFENKIDGDKKVQLNIFAPPASGENDPAQGDDWMFNYYYEITKLPEIRLEFEPVCE